jgi:hypothetical protein
VGVGNPIFPVDTVDGYRRVYLRTPCILPGHFEQISDDVKRVQVWVPRCLLREALFEEKKQVPPMKTRGCPNDKIPMGRHRSPTKVV